MSDSIDERLRQMDLQAMNQYLAMAREQMAAERALEADHAARAQSWEKSIRGVEELMRMHGLQVASDAGEMSQEQALREMLNGPRPSIGEAVLAVMRTQNQGWNARQVFVALERRGWSPPVQHPLRGVEAAMNRLNRAGKVEKLGRGRYRAKPKP